jgi:IS6 family transposase
MVTLTYNEGIGGRKMNLETRLNLFKWKHYEAEIIFLTVRWYLRYSLSYRDLAEIMSERGLHITPSTI